MESLSKAATEKAAESPTQRGASLLARLSIAHFVAIILLSVLTLGSYLVLRDATVRLTDTGTILTASRQRWVAQRVSLQATQLILATDEIERNRIRDAIRDQIVNIQSGLDLLLSGQLEPNQQISDDLAAIFFESPFRVDYYTRGVIEAAYALIDAPSDELVRENDDLQRLQSMNSLLTTGLDRIVVQSRNERWAAIESLETLQLVLTLSTLLGLAGIFVMIFLPMQRQIRDESRRMISEIDERKRVQQALMESEERYRSLFAALSEGVVMQDMSARIVTCNESAEEILGLTRDQMMGLTSYDPDWRAIHEDGSPFPGDDHPAVKTIRTGQAYSNQIMGVHKPDGTLTWIRINCEPILRDGTEDMVGVVCSFADITESKTVQDELSRSRDLLQTVMDNSPDSIFIKDREERFVMVNMAEARLWGKTTPADLVGLTLSDLISQDVVDRIREDSRDVLEKGMPVLDKLQHFNGVDGSERWFSTTLVPLRDEHGEVNGMLGIARDITERRHAEAQAQELERERDKVEVLSDLMRDTSHELRTPLSIINTSLYLIRRENSPEKRAERITIIEQQVRHLTMLLEQMHTMSVLDNSGQFSMTPLDVRHILDEISSSATQQAEDQHKTLHVEFADDLPHVEGNERQLRFAVRHLLDNAIYFTQKDGQIWLRAYISRNPGDEPPAVTIEVRDNGIGISEDELPFIFDRFYKVDKARTLSGSGAGLGLSMVKKIVDIHRGRIEVDSRPDEGSVFRIVLPAYTVIMSRS